MANGAPSVKIILDSENEKIEVGEKFYITIEATDIPGNLDISNIPPGIKKLYQTTRHTTKVSTINGHTESVQTTSLILTCKGETPGRYNFGPVTVGGRKSNTISYQVVPATPGKNKNTASPSQGSSQLPDPSAGPLFIGKGNEEMFLKAFVNHTSAYEQEAIEYTVKLYTTYGDIKFLGAAAAPKFDGFVVEESSDVSSSLKFEDYNGKTFKTAVIARYIIFPQKAGVLKVTGNTYTVSTDARQYYHDPYYQTITVKQPVQLNVTPNDVEIDVKELPTPVPADFIGGVGQFRISSYLPSASLTTNTAASIVYTVQGDGNLKYIKLPELSYNFPNSFETYSPNVSVDAGVAGGTVQGSAKFDYSFIPRESGDYVIPGMKFSYFDPADGKYKTLRTEEYKVEVALGQTSSKSQQMLSFNSDLMPEGKADIKLGAPYVMSLLYWLWYVVPVILFVASFAVYRRYLREHDNIEMFRSKNANKVAMQRLATAAQGLKNKNEDVFYNEMLNALWGYIADKLKMPTSELNRANVSEEFKKHGVKEETFQPILNLIDECEYAKYTPVSREANMHQLYAQALSSLSKVESEYTEETAHKEDSDSDSDSDEGAANADSKSNAVPDSGNDNTDTDETDKN